MFTLVCSTAAGDEVRLGYDPHTSKLLNPDGTPVFAHDGDRTFGEAPVHRVSANSPGRKSSAPDVLKIQLGLNCNYSCSYCSQASEIASAAITKTSDVHAFLSDLDRWIEAPPRHIEFWGGEPLLYFAKLQLLVPELDRRFPNAGFSMLSNGSLLDDEKVEFILDHDIEFVVSHDGPGQSHRGADPFDDEQCLRSIRHLWSALKGRGRMSFNTVLTPSNSDPARIRRWFAERLCEPDVVVNFEGVVATYDERTRDGVGAWSPAQYAGMRRDIAHAFETGEALKVPALLHRSRDFIDSLAGRRPSTVLGQKCSMDREDHIAVDLQSNVLTCQNTGGAGKHRIGSALAMADVALDTSTHWGLRDCCSHCPVLQLCRGSCMFLEGEEFAQSCENEYHYNLGVLDGILRRALGLHMVSVEGDVRRPARRRVISIVAENAGFGAAGAEPCLTSRA